MSSYIVTGASGYGAEGANGTYVLDSVYPPNGYNNYSTYKNENNWYIFFSEMSSSWGIGSLIGNMPMWVDGANSTPDLGSWTPWGPWDAVTVSAGDENSSSSSSTEILSTSSSSVNSSSSSTSSVNSSSSSSGDINIALAATATASTTYSGYSADNAHDGSEDTTEGPSYSWTNDGYEMPCWWHLDFGSAKQYRRVEMFFTAVHIVKGYKLQYSTDDSNWTDIVEVTTNVTVHRTHEFDPVTSQYFRVWCTSGPDSQTNFTRLNEVEIYNAEIENSSSSSTPGGDESSSSTPLSANTSSKSSSSTLSSLGTSSSSSESSSSTLSSLGISSSSSESSYSTLSSLGTSSSSSESSSSTLSSLGISSSSTPLSINSSSESSSSTLSSLGTSSSSSESSSSTLSSLGTSSSSSESSSSTLSSLGITA